MNKQEMSQKQLHQLRSLQCQLEYVDYYSSEEEEEDPIPRWNIPTWTGNSLPEITNDVPYIKCTGCTTRITHEGTNRGCEECDEYWDMPMLENEDGFTDNDYVDADEDYDADTTHLAEFIYLAHEKQAAAEDNNEVKPYCEGCEFLKSGLGGENQLSHACLGYY